MLRRTATNWIQASFKFLRKLPLIRNLVQKELGKHVKGMEEDMSKQIGDMKYNRKLPEKGWNKQKIVSEIKQCMDLGEFKAETGALSGMCHKPPNMDRVEAVTEAYRMTAFANPLNPDAFPGIRKLEAEVVRMTLNLFNGDDNCCGTMTSGGTESLILACKAYRNYAKATRGVTKPNIVMSRSGHVGFDKGGHVLGMEVRHVPMDTDTWHPDLNKYERAIDSNTVMLVASAPQYPHGVMDPVEKIAAIARRKKLPLHVDACLGGFLIVFMKDCGFNVDPFDFRVKGVTSISADTHKFGYAPKGSSVIMYSDKKYIHHQYYISSDWSGGIFVSPTMAGSRSGGIIAATWASLVNHGLDGYRSMTKNVVSTLNYIVQGIRAIDGLEVLGDPRFCIVAFRSSKFHIYSLADEMKERGWLMSCLQFPTCVHMYVTPMHTQDGIKERFMKDLRECAANQSKKGNSKLEGRVRTFIHLFTKVCATVACV